MSEIDIRYKRSGSSNYMILPADEEAPEHERQMLENNDIEFLLPFFSVTNENDESFWYDITGKKNMRYLFESRSCDRGELVTLLISLFDALDRLSEYLIATEHILINENLIYMSIRGQEKKIFLCYNPAGKKSLDEGIRDLFEYYISVMNHEDELLVDVIYGIYESMCEGSFSIQYARKSLYELAEKDFSLANEDMNSFYQEDISEHLDLNDRGYSIDPDVKSSNKNSTEEIILKESNSVGDFWDEEEFEEESVFSKLINMITSIPSMFKEKVVTKKEEYFPPKDLEEDLIFEPKKYIPQPTVMLSDMEGVCFGKLNYEGDGNEKDYSLIKERINIGSRDDSNEVLLHSSVVSRHHAVIHKKGSDYYIEDLNSTNGTYVNGEAVEVGQMKLLHPMDKILFADVPYRLV